MGNTPGNGQHPWRWTTESSCAARDLLPVPAVHAEPDHARDQSAATRLVQTPSAPVLHGSVRLGACGAAEARCCSRRRPAGCFWPLVPHAPRGNGAEDPRHHPPRWPVGHEASGPPGSYPRYAPAQQGRSAGRRRAALGTLSPRTPSPAIRGLLCGHLFRGAARRHTAMRCRIQARRQRPATSSTPVSALHQLTSEIEHGAPCLRILFQERS